jgi:alpha/beta superfamily hydrolase
MSQLMLDKVTEAVRQSFQKETSIIQHPHEVVEKVARAVIKVMREPTQEMCMAVKSNHFYEGDFDDIWHTAIDAALNGFEINEND